MGLWDTFVRSLGLARDPVARPPAPPAPTPAAARRLAALPSGHGLRLWAVPAPAGWLAQAREEPLEAPPHEGFGGLPVHCDDVTFARLAGVTLHHDGATWRILAPVEIRARETPNPDSRLFLTDRILAAGRVHASRRTPHPPWIAEQLLARDDVRGVLLRDATLTVEREPGVPWDPIEAAVGVAIRGWALALGEPVRPRPDRDHDQLVAAVREVLEHRILPGVHADGGHLELDAVDDGVVRLRMVGACRTCPASALTLRHGVERVLRERFPGEIERVEAIDG